MRAANVAPDYSRLVVENPLYRVDFWENLGGESWDLDVWLLFDCVSVFEALAWASADARHRSFQLLVSTDSKTESEQLVVLIGSNPTTG
jgi:hypothetical protein